MGLHFAQWLGYSFGQPKGENMKKLFLMVLTVAVLAACSNSNDKAAEAPKGPPWVADNLCGEIKTKKGMTLEEVLKLGEGVPHYPKPIPPMTSVDFRGESCGRPCGIVYRFLDNKLWGITFTFDFTTKEEANAYHEKLTALLVSLSESQKDSGTGVLFRRESLIINLEKPSLLIPTKPAVIVAIGFDS